MFKNINHDIKVSWVFTMITYLVVIGIIIADFYRGADGFSINMLYYGFPLSLLSIFFSRTATRVKIDESNHRAIQRSFYLSLGVSGFSFLWLIISFTFL